MARRGDGAAPALVWFRDDLRLADNPALHDAAHAGAPLVALFGLEEIRGTPGRGAASLWWLHHSLRALASDLEARDVSLVLRRGDPADIVPEIASALGAATVFWNRRYGPAGQRDAVLAEALGRDGIAVRESAANLLHDPDRLTTKGGGPYRVFTPFWRALSATFPPRPPLPAPATLDAATHALKSDRLDDWALLPSGPDWAGGLRETWEPGEAGAARRLEHFLDGKIDRYADGRDRPDAELTSGLSPHLHFGEISPIQIWHAVDRNGSVGNGGGNASKFLSEIGWRDFSYHLLEHKPDLGATNFNAKFDSFPWVADDDALAAWQRGLTGYPIVDAGMRQLWQCGWMHNRVRMITASFLIKDLMIDWRAGAAWFWDTLVDADPANNSASWRPPEEAHP